MTPLILVATLLATQPLPEPRLVAPADLPRAPYRWLLLPDPLDQTAGDAVPLAQEAEEALNQAVPQRNMGSPWERDLADLEATPLAEVEAGQLEAVLKPLGPTLELFERAARCRRADWSAVADQTRRAGLFRGFSTSPEFGLGARLLALRARLHLKQERPAAAVGDLALALGLLRHLEHYPSRYRYYSTARVAHTVLDALAECQASPGCPCLADALAQLPRPLLSTRGGLEAERLGLYGVFPQAEQVLADPVGTRLEAEALERLTLAFRIFSSFADRPVEEATARLQMGLAIQKADGAARAALREAGYAEKVVAATPALNAALLHALLASEERLSRYVEAHGLPFAQASARVEALNREAVPLPAIPTPRYRLAGDPGLLQAEANLERRLDLLRVVEALRRHAHRTGSFPDKLADITGVAVPDDPLTGLPFEYRRDGALAILKATGPDSPWLAPGMAVVVKLRPREGPP